MNELQIVNFDGVDVVDSRDVAAMVERDHYELLKSIRVYAQYLAEGEIPVGDFFVESTYLDGNNQERPNYLITKKGCDMIANKMTGKKGVLFTAAYVSAFERMRKQVATTQQLTPAQLIAAQAQVLVDMEQKMLTIQSQAKAIEAQQAELAQRVDTAIKVFSRPSEDHWKADVDQAIKDLCEERRLSDCATRGRMYRELEEKCGCNVNTRLTRLRQRVKKQGMRHRDAMALTKLDAIAADKQLRAAFEGIVREWQARSAVVEGQQVIRTVQEDFFQDA